MSQLTEQDLRPSRSESRGRSVLPLLALWIGTSLAYISSFAGTFVYDDGHCIVDNPSIRSIGNALDTQTYPPPVTGALVIGFELRDQRIRHMVLPYAESADSPRCWIVAVPSCSGHNPLACAKTAQLLSHDCVLVGVDVDATSTTDGERDVHHSKAGVTG